MNRFRRLLPVIAILLSTLTACQQADGPRGNFDPLTLAIGGLLIGAGLLTIRQEPGGFKTAVRRSLPHLLGLWTPLVGGLLLLYLFVIIRLIDNTPFDAAGDSTLANPRWAVVLLWLVGLWEMLQFGRRLAGLYMADRPVPTFKQVKCLALLVAGLGALYVAINNPYSPLLLAPLLLWLFIGDRSGAGRLLDWLLFLGRGGDGLFVGLPLQLPALARRFGRFVGADDHLLRP